MSGMNEQREIDLSILGKNYQILCNNDEEIHLRAIVKTLEEKLNRIRDRYPKATNEKIIMLQTINVMRKNQKLEELLNRFEVLARNMNAKIDESMNKNSFLMR